MQPNEKLQKIVKIFIFAFLCNEMQTSHTPFATSQESEIIAKTLEKSLANVRIANVHNARHQASIRLIAKEQIYGAGHICSGTLVASSVVLTVAECVQSVAGASGRLYHPAELRVVLGSLHLSKREAHTLVLGVTHIQRSPSNELAILRLERDIPTAQAHIQPIAYATKKLPTSQSSAAVVSCWCAYKLSKNLNLPLFSLNATLQHVEQCPHLTLQDDFFVRYATPVLEPLQAGAALLTPNNQLLLGLGKLRSSAAGIAVYVDVGAHAPWLQQQIGDGSNQNSGMWGLLGFLAFTAYTFCSGRALATK